jgi:L-alanine-DL-glutamate epimerase-like enolase superfamily enzyme
MTDGPEITRLECFVVKHGTDDGSPDGRLHGTDYYVNEGTNGIVYSRGIEQLLVKVTASNGLSGWGEVQAPVVPEVAETLVEDLLGPFLMGADPLQTEALWDRLYDAMNVRGHFSGFYVDAMAGLDIALWDLKGRHLSQSVATLLASRRRETLPAYVTGPEDVDAIREAGYAGVKIGHVTELSDVTDRFSPETIASMDVDLLVDHHWGNDAADTAIPLAEDLAELGVRFVEAPLPPEDVDGYARVADAVSIPVAGGESLRTADHFKRRFERDALDIAQPDINRTGLTEGRRIAHLADSFGRPIAPHVGGSLGVAMAATWQLSSAIDRFSIQEHQLGRMEFSNAFLDPVLAVEDGELVVPEGNGLGVDVVESDLEPYVTSHTVVE